MKNRYKINRIHALALGGLSMLFAIVPSQVEGALSTGTAYTIDNTIPASATNYTTFQAFFGHMYNNSRNDGGPVNGSGVTGSGNLTVQVLAGGTFNEQVTVYQTTGLSASTRVIIKGNNATLTFNATSAARHTIWMNGADYFTFDSLNIIGTNANYAYVVRLSGQANYNIFRNCTIAAPNYNWSGTTSSSPTSSWSNSTMSSALVAFTSNASNLPTTSSETNGKGNLFENNILTGPPDGSTLVGPSFGIFELSSTSTLAGENEYIGNQIKNISTCGYLSTYNGGFKFNNNTITRKLNSNFQGVISSTYFYGIQMYRPYLSTYSSKDIEIKGNVIKEIGTILQNNAYQFYGIAMVYANGNGSSSNPGYAGSNVFRIEGNTIKDNVAGSSYTTSAYMYQYYFYYSQAVLLVNNLFANNTAFSNYSSAGSRYSYNYSYWYYTTGEIVNNTYYRKMDYQSQLYGATDYLYFYGSTYSYTNPSQPYKEQCNAYNNIINYDITGTLGYYYNYLPYIYYWSHFSNNAIFQNLKKANYNCEVYYAYYVGGSLSSPYSQISVKDFNNNAGAKDNIWADPKFVDPDNGIFIPTNPALKSSGYNYSSAAYPSGITKDINGDSRNPLKPSMGAVEPYFESAISGAFNGGVYSLCGGDKAPLAGSVKSFLPFDLPNAKVGYKLNNKAIVYQDLGTLPAGGTVNFDFGKLDFTGAPTNTVLKAFIAHPDDNTVNDTLTFNIYVGRGAYGGIVTTNPTTKGYEPNEAEGRTYWITIPGDIIKMDISAPSEFTNAEYGTKYSVATEAHSMSGVLLPPATTSYSHNPSTGGTWSINPPDAYIDSFITVSMKLHNILSGCDSLVQRTVFVAPYGKPDFKDPKACMGTNVEFENLANVQSGYLTYEWDFGNGQTSTNTNGKTKYMTPGTYQVTLKTTTVPYGFVKSKTKSIVISEGPIADFTVNSKCFGSPVTLTNTTTSNVGVPNYTWDFGDGQTSNAVNPTVNYASKGMYDITLTAEKNGCSTTETKNVAMFDQPTANFTLSSGSCANAPFVFSNTSSVSAGKIGYLWSFGENNEQSTQQQGTYTYKTAGTKTVKLVVSSTLGCKDSIIKPVSVLPGPTGEFTVTGECQDGDIVFASTDPALSGTTYNWIIDGQAQSGLSSVTKQYSLIGTRSASLTVNYTNGCSNTSTKSFAVKPMPKADFVAGGNICANSNILIENKTKWTDGDVTYTWDLGDGNTSVSQHPNHSYLNSGNINVKLTANVVNGCSDQITKTLTVNPAPKRCQFTINYDGSKGLRSYNFEPTDGNNVGAESGVTYTWYFGTGASNQATKGAFDYIEDGSYTVTMRANTSSGCECESTQQLVINRTGVSDVVNNNGFNVYPNPSTGLFKVEVVNTTKEGQVEVFDIIGNKLFSYTHAEMDAINWTIDLSNQSNGVYMVRYSADNQIVTKKIRLVK
ncbi:MAG: PKD domain-containing protein [Bacteroidia bacterium]|nr:PKD domain-containing protein [Bacteroidia bacterium]